MRYRWRWIPIVGCQRTPLAAELVNCKFVFVKLKPSLAPVICHVGILLCSHERNYFRDSNPPVLAGNLPFLGIISVLPFSLQNLLFFVFSKKSQICYTYSLKSSKNSTSNASLLKQLKKPERTVKNQDRLLRCGLYKRPNVIAM